MKTITITVDGDRCISGDVIKAAIRNFGPDGGRLVLDCIVLLDSGIYLPTGVTVEGVVRRAR